MSRLENFDHIDMAVGVTKGDTGEELWCANTNACIVRYTWDYTPIIHKVVPPVVYPGLQAAVLLNPMKCPNYKREDELPIDLRIDGTAFNHTDPYVDPEEYDDEEESDADEDGSVDGEVEWTLGNERA